MVLPANAGVQHISSAQLKTNLETLLSFAEMSGNSFKIYLVQNPDIIEHVSARADSLYNAAV